MTERSKAVIDGVVQYFSASGLATGDPSERGGCPRKWWYKYVGGLPEPEKSYQAVGKDTHDSIEKYLKTGDMVLNRIALSGKIFIPEPNRDYLVEHRIPEGDLEIAGVPVVGLIDLVNPTGSYVAPSGKVVTETGSVEIVDWKTTANLSRGAKTGIELLKTIQMPLYGKWALRKYNKPQVRLSHVYMQTKGMSKSSKSTILASEEEIEARWASIESTARTLKDLVKETEPEKVPKNLKACPVWSGCAYAGVCPKSSADLITRIFGGGAMEERFDVLEELRKLKGEDTPQGPKWPEGFDLAVKSIEDLGRGFPPLQEKEAEAYRALKGPDASVSGKGEFGTLRPLNFEQIFKIAGQVAPKEEPAPEPEAVVNIGITRPNTPASDPALAADPIAGFVVLDDEPAKAVEPPKEPEVLAPEESPKPEASPKRDYKKMKKGELVALLESLDNGGPSPEPGLESKQGLIVHVNAVPSGQFDHLDKYLRDICVKIEKATGCSDIRASSHDSLSYGKWEGILAGAIRSQPPEPGVYYISARGDKLYEVAANALVQIADGGSRGL